MRDLPVQGCANDLGPDEVMFSQGEEEPIYAGRGTSLPSHGLPQNVVLDTPIPEELEPIIILIIGDRGRGTQCVG